MYSDVLDGFERTTFTDDGKARTVFRLGTGPAVIVIAEMPGISPKVIEFARRVAAIGCTAVVPHLFGTPGRNAGEGRVVRALPYARSSMVPACISREFAPCPPGRN